MSYTPGVVPDDPKDLSQFLHEELNKLAGDLHTQPARYIEFLHVAPTRPREGMTVGADGTNWNPGSGQGVYCYYGAAWNKL